MDVDWGTGHWPVGKDLGKCLQRQGIELASARGQIFFCPGACTTRALVSKARVVHLPFLPPSDDIPACFFPNLVTSCPFLSLILSFFQLEQRRKIGVHLGYFNSGSKSLIFIDIYSINSVHENQKKPFFIRNFRSCFCKLKCDLKLCWPSLSLQSRPGAFLDHLETSITIDSLSLLHDRH